MMADASIKAVIEAAVFPRLRRWMEYLEALKRGDAGGGGPGLIGHYDVAGTGGQTARVVQLDIPAALIEEAQDTAADIDALPDDEKQALRVQWLEAGTIHGKADTCECGVMAYYRRLDRAYERLFVKWCS